jgi:hypothetical protein
MLTEIISVFFLFLMTNLSKLDLYLIQAGYYIVMLVNTLFNIKLMQSKIF